MSSWTRPEATSRWRLAGLLAGFGIILAGAIAVGALLRSAEQPGGATPFDASITTWVVAHRSGALTAVARVLSFLGSQVVLAPVALIIAVVAWRRGDRVAAGRLLLAWAGAIGLYTLTKQSVQRMRPPRHIWLTDVGHTTSFPSGHATQSLATFVALALVCAIWRPQARRALCVIAVAVAIGVAWSRVYLGVHWTTDVLAGALIAATWLAVVLRLVAPARPRDPAADPRDPAADPRDPSANDGPTHPRPD